jgi:hypothetical protein
MNTENTLEVVGQQFSLTPIKDSQKLPRQLMRRVRAASDCDLLFLL